MDESTFPLKDCLLSVVVRPTVCVFKWFHTNSSGFRSGEYGGRKNNRKAPPRLSTKALVFLARCAGPRSTIKNIFCVVPLSNRFRNSMNTPALTPPSVIMKRICPFDVMAEIKLKPKRAPVPVATIGVSPTLPHVRPA